jgi:UDP-2,3-diacylglucosamine pyrophosphatase LpxH
MPRPLVVVSDVHLSRERGRDVARELARLVRSEPDAELVLAGDSFDLSLDPPGRAPAESVTALLDAQPELRAALGAHVAGGAPLTLLGGNHDAAVARTDVRDALRARLELLPNAPLDVAPWFLRRGALHVEHGHVYDPDNAPAHPLAPWCAASEPLGVALTRRFLAPSGALVFAHAHATTPAAGLKRTFEMFGWRAPLVVARYFATAGALCLQAQDSERRDEERRVGESALAEVAECTGVEVERLNALIRVRPKPTHHGFADTFMRLYFDRVIATVAGASSAAVALATASPTALGLAALSAGYLAYSVATGGSRYGDGAVGRLRAAARDTAELTGTKLVVLGHTHHEDDAPGYLNTGSFAFSGRGSYVHVDERGRAERRYGGCLLNT